MGLDITHSRRHTNRVMNTRHYHILTIRYVFRRGA